MAEELDENEKKKDVQPTISFQAPQSLKDYIKQLAANTGGKPGMKPSAFMRGVLENYAEAYSRKQNNRLGSE